MSRPRVDRAALLTGARSRVATPSVNPLLPVEPDDPFTPHPIDPATITGTDAERLAAFEAAIERATAAAGESLRAAKARFAIEAGTALRAIQGSTLYTAAGHDTFAAYAKARWGLSRSRAYQLAEAALAMLAVSEILDTAPVESQALALAPVLAHHGKDAARKVVDAARQESGKVTAAAIRKQAGRLGYVPHPAPSPAAEEDQEQSALALLEQALAALRTAHRGLRGRVLTDAITEDPARARELAAEAAKIAARIARIAEKGTH